MRKIVIKFYEMDPWLLYKKLSFFLFRCSGFGARIQPGSVLIGTYFVLKTLTGGDVFFDMGKCNAVRILIQDNRIPDTFKIRQSISGLFSVVSYK